MQLVQPEFVASAAVMLLYPAETCPHGMCEVLTYCDVQVLLVVDTVQRPNAQVVRLWQHDHTSHSAWQACQRGGAARCHSPEVS